jgi:hypothetical protein
VAINSQPQRLFLLSPADCGGKRAQLLRNRGASFELARRLRSTEGASLGEVFSFLSGLYFRGKLAYARSFARPPHAEVGIAVITAGDGLQPVDTSVRLADLDRYAGVPIDPREARYRAPLERDLSAMAQRLDDDCHVVLLGSIATGKYLDVLSAALGRRLYYPKVFVGLGDMSRGALLLRSAAAQTELEYVIATSAARSR